MSFSTTKGIVLRQIPFKEKQKILTIFSQDLGLTSMIIKGLFPKASHKLVFTQPFCEAEFSFSKKNSDLLLFEEGSVVDLHLPLRNDLSSLKTASKLSSTILSFQMPGKESSPLYALLSTFLKQIPFCPCNRALLACFYLKMLGAEGVYTPSEIAKESHLTDKEKSILLEINNLKSFQRLKELSIEESTLSKVENILSSKR